MDFGKKIQELRKKNNLSQEDLAEKVGVARQTISKWELEETAPDLKQSKELSKIFGVSLDELIDNKSINSKGISDSMPKNNNSTSKGIFSIGLFFIDILVGAFFIILALWIIVLATFCIACLVVAVCLLANINFSNIIPNMPYGCGVIVSLTFISLSILSATGTVWFTALLNTIFKSYKQFHYQVLHGTKEDFHNSIIPKFSKKTAKTLRLVTIITVLCFITFLILSLITCMLTSSSLDFWHTWNWFK